MGGVQQVGHGAQLGRGLPPRLPHRARGVDLDRRVPVAEAGEHHGVLVRGDHQVVRHGHVQRGVVEHLRVLAQPVQGGGVLRADLVDGHELLVQVVEGGAGGLEPVLEHGDVPHGGRGRVEVPHRVGGQGQERVVLVRGEGARGGQLVVVHGAVDEVPPGDHHVVRAAEECGRRRDQLRLGHRRRLLGGAAGGAQLRGDDGAHVGAAGLGGQVLVTAAARVRGEFVAVVETPVVVAEDLEEVGDPAEGRGRLPEPLRGRVPQDLPGRGAVVGPRGDDA